MRLHKPVDLPGFKNLSSEKSMRHTPPRAMYLVLCFVLYLLLGSSAIAQSPDPSPSPTPDPTTTTDDQNAADPNAAASPADQDRIDMVKDTDSVDLPAFFKGLIDTEEYLRMRNAHN